MSQEEELDLNELGQVYNRLLRKIFFQVYRAKYNQSWKGRIIRFFYFAFFFSLPFSFFLSQLISWLYMTIFTEQMLSIALIFNISCIMVRVTTFCTLADELESLYLNFAEFHCNQHRPMQAIKELNKTYRNIFKYDFRICVFFIVNVSNWFVVPIILHPEVFNLITGRTFNYENWASSLPCLVFIKINSPWREIRYVLDIIVAFFSNSFWIASDMLYFSIFMLLETQYTLLGNCLIRDDTIDAGNKEAISYRYFVEDHNKLIKVSKTLEKHLRLTLASVLATAGVLIGSNLLIMSSGVNESASVGEMTEFYTQFLGYLSLAMIELYIFCSLSEIINTACLSIAEAIYDSAWYSKLRPEEKNLILSLKVSQKGINITAVKIVKINLKTFMEVLRLSYSFFTIMKEGMNKTGKERNVSIL